MKRIFIFLFFGANVAFAQSSSFKNAKNVDIYFSTLKNLDLFYVDTIDFDDLMQNSIDEMLQSLDPYTVRISEDAASDFDLSITGNYGGVGMLIREHERKVEIAELYEGYPAQKAGANVGDRILFIDTIDLQNKKITEVSNSLKGKIGTSVSVKLLRYDTKDTAILQIKREKIHLPAVPYFGLISNTKVGYISFSTFTTNCSDEVRQAFVQLKEMGATSLLLDLRSNTGGSMDEAVNIAGLFVPKKQNVVSMKGRAGKETQFKTRNSPVDTDMPMAVLINGMSASSSEIVAGALQDLDRAVIMGQKSFGKGLVQSVIPLPFNQRMKITTARYYTPSGRCVQAINYSHKGGKNKDSIQRRTFKTANGRTVYDAGGITPDISLQRSKYSHLVQALVEKEVIYNFANRYYASHKNKPDIARFTLSDADYQEFVAYSKESSNLYQTIEEQKFGDFKKALASRNDSAAVFNDYVASMEAALQKQKFNDLITLRSEIQPFIEQEIASRYAFHWGRIQTMLRYDREVEEAVKLLQDKDLYASNLQ